MRFAYADPPYLGCCKLYDHYHPDGRCWDDVETHRLLIERLCDEYPDGWAMSASSPSQRALLPLCPDDVRVAPWVKPFASFKPNVNPAFTWEPVIFRGGRKHDRYDPTVKDHFILEDSALTQLLKEMLDPTLVVVESITLKKGLTGAKPEKFCFKVFDLLGMEPEDEIADLFPGTGIVTQAWERYRTVKAVYAVVQEGLAI